MGEILVALDGSERAPSVLDAAVKEARQAGASLCLYRAVSLPVGVRSEAFSITFPDLGEQLLKDGRDELVQLAHKVEGVDVTTVCRLDAPWFGICEVARERNVDLIVLGSHGYHFIDRFWARPPPRS